MYKLKKIGYDRMPRVEKRLKSVPVGVVLHFSPKAVSGTGRGFILPAQNRSVTVKRLTMINIVAQ